MGNIWKMFSFLCLLVSVSPLMSRGGNSAYAQSADSTFSRYFRQAQAFSDAYPREKAHLHFDNTSYYLGDTIWFKAYVTLAETNAPSSVSKPLYVELLDQLGNVMERQTIQLENGEGHGQIALNGTFFTGYYEVRAYTKWMLAFKEQQYFSRTLPVYRNRLTSDEKPRSIATYRMDESMKQRPNDKDKKFEVRFFPEGGQLIHGIPAIVAFEADSREEGLVNIEGVVRTTDGEEVTQLQALHNGMGAFLYTPGEKAAIADVSYKGKSYRFKLPEALPAGYALQVHNKEKVFEITVSRSSQDLSDTLGLFISSQGRPYRYVKMDFDGRLSRKFQLPVNGLPGGVTQITLLTSQGTTICERFCYVMPPMSAHINIQTNKTMYQPFEPICCKVDMKDNQNKPVRTTFSIAIRDGAKSDYQEYDNSIYTDLLLTSDLKGYIHQPGFYFAEQSEARRKMLDVLLLIHGWRKYDMSQIVSGKELTPFYLPETSLILHGQIKSLLGKEQRHIDVSVLAHKDSISIAGMTKTDSLGYFYIPVDGFTGNMESYFQTRNEGKKVNKSSLVSLFRNFEPSLRKLNYYELNPIWKEPEDLSRQLAELDAAYRDSISGEKNHWLDEVVVKSKYMKKLLKQTEHFEKEILGYYNMTQIVDRMRDEGKYVDNLPELMEKINPNIQYRVTSTLNEKTFKDQLYKLSYSNNLIKFVVNGNYMSESDMEWVLYKDVDAIKSMMLYHGLSLDKIAYAMNKRNNRAQKLEEKGFWSNMVDGINTEDIFNPDVSVDDMMKFEAKQEGTQDTKSTDGIKDFKSIVVCSITTIEDWDPKKIYKTHRGIRHTYIQGYSKPLEFYSPAYKNGAPLYAEDYRRTLYWNPNVETNAQGEAIIQCYNSDSSAPLTVSVETLYGGCPAALSSHSNPTGSK